MSDAMSQSPASDADVTEQVLVQLALLLAEQRAGRAAMQDRVTELEQIVAAQAEIIRRARAASASPAEESPNGVDAEQVAG